MPSALLIRLRPRGPWRYGPADGAHDGVDTLYRSDRLFSAVTLAFQKLGYLEEWLEVTARSGQPGIAFSSLFPFQGDTLFAIPPANVWPPPANQITAPNPVFLAKIRWKSVAFVPVTVIDTLLTGGSVLADQWLPDPESACLLRRDRPTTTPLRIAIRRSAAVDRVTRQTHAVSSSATVEFEPGAGLWTVVRFANDLIENTWRARIEGAFRLLADSGFGGRRSAGWGQAQEPEFTRGDWPGFVFPKLTRASKNSAKSSRYWLLSLFVPGTQDAVDWADGTYQIVTRAGRIENGASGGGERKSLRMIAEGSVLAASGELAGAAVDVAPENFAHPVYRSGLALAIELPEITQTAAIEEPQTEEAVIEAPWEPVAEPAAIVEKEAEIADAGVVETLPAPAEALPEATERAESEPSEELLNIGTPGEESKTGEATTEPVSEDKPGNEEREAGSTAAQAPEISEERSATGDETDDAI